LIDRVSKSDERSTHEETFLASLQHEQRSQDWLAGAQVAEAAACKVTEEMREMWCSEARAARDAQKMERECRDMLAIQRRHALETGQSDRANLTCELQERCRSSELLETRLEWAERDLGNRDRTIHELTSELTQARGEALRAQTYEVEVQAHLSEQLEEECAVAREAQVVRTQALREEGALRDSLARESEEHNCARQVTLLAEQQVEQQELAAELASARHRQALEEHTTCSICMTTPRDVLLQPCGHYALCSSCADRVEQCPICRANITNKIRVHAS